MCINNIVYKIIIPELTQVVYYNKYFNTYYQKIKIYVDQLNNTNVNNNKLIDYYKNNYDKIMQSILNLNSINYFKSFIEIITKFIFYNKLTNNNNNQLKKIINRKNLYKLIIT
jgi:hypothetical protein